MKPRVTVITIGVDDLEASLRFYRDGLGAASAGATILKPAQDTFWGGYSGYFQDPDGHPWEVVWNPQWSE